VDSFGQPKQQKVDLEFGTWNVGLCRFDLLKTVARDLMKYKLNLMGIQEVRWNKGSSQPADDYTLFCGNGNADHNKGTGFL
jgi:hypothetical protein